MLQLSRGIQSILESFGAVKPKEQVLIVADDDGNSMWMGQIVMDVAGAIGAEAVLSIIPSPENIGGAEPPKPVAAAMKTVNSIIRITGTGAGLVHCNARKEATAAGARYYILDSSEANELKKGVSPKDVQLIDERNDKLVRRLSKTKIARVTSPAGTNITMGLAGRKAMPLGAKTSMVSGIPFNAETAIAPVEGTAEGTLVVDVAIVHWNYLLKEPLRLTVKGGKVTDISGSIQDADRLRKALATDENASNIAELGIGTSHIVPLPVKGKRRDVSRVGLVHFGFGRNNDLGGVVFSRIHLDGLLDRPSLYLDNECILKDGELRI